MGLLLDGLGFVCHLVKQFVPLLHAVAITTRVGVKQACHGAPNGIDFVGAEVGHLVAPFKPGLLGAHPPHFPFTLDEGMLTIHFDDILFHLFVGVLCARLLFLGGIDFAHQRPNRALRLSNFVLEQFDDVCLFASTKIVVMCGHAHTLCMVVCWSTLP